MTFHTFPFKKWSILGLKIMQFNIIKFFTKKGFYSYFFHSLFTRIFWSIRIFGVTFIFEIFDEYFIDLSTIPFNKFIKNTTPSTMAQSQSF